MFTKFLQYQSTHHSIHTHTSLGAHSFSVTSHKIYNSLSPALCSCNCHNTPYGLVTYSKPVFNAPPTAPPSFSDSSSADTVRAYKFQSRIYLLAENTINRTVKVTALDVNYSIQCYTCMDNECFHFNVLPFTINKDAYSLTV